MTVKIPPPPDHVPLTGKDGMLTPLWRTWFREFLFVRVGRELGNLEADLTGTASTATKLANARTIALSGDATGSAAFDGSADATIDATLGNGVVETENIAANAVSVEGRDYQAGVVNLTTSYIEVANVSIGLASGDAEIAFSCIVDADDTGGSAAHILSFRIKRNGTDIIGPLPFATCVRNRKYQGATTYRFFDAPGAGSYTYTIEMAWDATPTVSNDIREAYLTVRQLKR